jgi:heat shock protein HslJ
MICIAEQIMQSDYSKFAAIDAAAQPRLESHGQLLLQQKSAECT